MDVTDRNFVSSSSKLILIAIKWKHQRMEYSQRHIVSKIDV